MKKNFIYNSIYQVLALIIPIIITPYISRVLGVNNIGVFSYTFSIVSFFTIIAVLGTTTYGQRYIAFNRDNKEKLSRAFWEVVYFRLIMTIVVLTIYGFYIITFADYKMIYFTMSLNIINVAFDITWFYQGTEDFKKIVIRNSIVKFLNLFSVFIFVKKESDLLVYVLIYCGYIIVGNLSTWIGIHKKISWIRSIRPFKNFKDIFLLFVPTIAMQVYTILDKSMIGWFTKSTYENGCYEQAEKICRIAVTVVAALATVLSPRIANNYQKYKDGQCDKMSITRLLNKGIRGTCAISLPIMFGIIVITPVFVPVFLGNGYEKVCELLPVFSVLILPVGLANIIGIAYLIPTENHNVYTLSVMVAAGFNFIMNIILIPLFMSTGAAFASVIAEIVGVSIQLKYCVKKGDINTLTLVNNTWRYWASSFFMLALLLCVRENVTSSWRGLALLILLGIFTYGALLIILRDQLLIDSLVSLSKRMKIGQGKE